MAELKRGFGFWTGWFVVVASMVGTGILTNSGPILLSTSSHYGLLGLWFAGGFLALCGALTMGELASGLPKVGGDYVYVREAFGNAFGFVYGWSMVVVGFAAPVALVSSTTGNYLAGPLQTILPLTGSVPLLPTWIATFLVIGFTLSHCLSHRHSSWIQTITTLFSFLVLFAFAGFGMLFGHGSWNHFGASAPVSTLRVSALANGLILVMYAYTGWNAAVYLSGEIKNPAKLLPRCLAIGCLAVTALYLLVNLAYVYALPIDLLGKLSEAETNRIADVAIRRLLGDGASQIFSVLVSVGVCAGLSAYILTGPRIFYAMAKDGLCPQIAGKTGAHNGIPVMATLFQSALALFFLWSGTFEQILNYASYGVSVMAAFVVAPIFVLRRRSNFRPPFRVPGYPVTPIVFLLVTAFMLVGGAAENPRTALLSALTILLGFPIYYFLNSRLLRPIN